MEKMKLLTKRQKEIEAIRTLKNFLKNKVEADILNELKNIVKNVNLPQNWYLKDNSLLALFIFSEFCKKYTLENSDFSELTKKEFSEVKNQLINNPKK